MLYPVCILGFVSGILGFTTAYGLLSLKQEIKKKNQKMSFRKNYNIEVK